MKKALKSIDIKYQITVVWIICLLISIYIGSVIPFIFVSVCCCISYIVSFRIRTNHFPILIALFSIVVRLVYIFSVNTQPISDFELLFDSAVSYAKGDYNFNQTHYFFDWAYQTAFVIYEGIVIKIVGTQNAIMALKILNAIFETGSVLIVYFTLKNFADEKIARFGSIICSGLIFPITFVTVLSNQHISTFFFLLGLYFIVKKDSGLHWLVRSLLIGLFLALGNIMRPEGIIIIGALLGLLFFRIIKHEKDKLKLLSKNLVVILAAYFAVNWIISQVIIFKQINPEGLDNNNPLWKFVVGLNQKTNGTYSNDDYGLLYYKNLTYSQREEVERSLIEQRLGVGSKKLINLFLNKQKTFWFGNPMTWSYGHITDYSKTINIFSFHVPFGKVESFLSGAHLSQMLLLIAFSFRGLFYQIISPKNKSAAVYYLILVISAVVYCLIEVQTRYVYLQVFILCITALANIHPKRHIS